MVIEYNDFQLTDEQISAATMFIGRRNLRLYIKEHNARPSSIEPFFVLTDEEKERYRRVEYSRYIESYVEPGPNANGHEYVDLGLPSGLLWAKCNVGATAETEYGGLYQWGGTVDLTGGDASWNTYPYADGLIVELAAYRLTKYNINAEYGDVDNKTVLEPEDDAAHVIMGGDWKMPTNEQLQELLDNTIIEKNIVINGITGTKFVNKSDSSKYIFIPFAGYLNGTGLNFRESFAYVWGSTLLSVNDRSYDSSSLSINANRTRLSYSSRSTGQSVRGVIEPII